jgi:hypothetical protein
MSNEQNHICGNEDCRVVETGKCAEGFDTPEECPKYSLEPSNEREDSVEKAPEDSPEPMGINLFGGDALNDNESLSITRRALTRVVVIAGAQKSGKTTILKTIYDMFQKGQFSGYLFAGSKSMLAFEERCFPSRLASGMPKADTARTQFGLDDKLLHLCVRRVDLSEPRQDLLFSDISGETFEHVSASSDDCSKQIILKRADHFAITIDGERLIDLATRHAAEQEAKMLFRRCIETKMVGKNTYVQIIFTKYDVFKDDNKTVNEFIPKITDYFKANHSDDVLDLNFFNIAAQPRNESDIKDGHGLDELFPLWVEKTHCLTHSEIDMDIDISGDDREFIKFHRKAHSKEGA